MHIDPKTREITGYNLIGFQSVRPCGKSLYQQAGNRIQRSKRHPRPVKTVVFYDECPETIPRRCPICGSIDVNLDGACPHCGHRPEE